MVVVVLGVVLEQVEVVASHYCDRCSKKQPPAPPKPPPGPPQPSPGQLETRSIRNEPYCIEDPIGHSGDHVLSPFKPTVVKNRLLGNCLP